VLNISEGGLWQISGDNQTANAPDNDYYYCFCYGTLGVKQVLAVQVRNTKSWIGTIRGDAVTWSRLDNFGCNTPADLASLLGVNADNARQYIIDKVNTVAIEGDFRWDKGSAIVEIYDHVNTRVYAKFAIGGNNKSLEEVIYRIENQTLSGSTYPLKVYYYGTTQSGRVTFAGNLMAIRITCSTSISLSSNTDTTGMTEKTFS
jgi:hypothetical protein